MGALATRRKGSLGPARRLAHLRGDTFLRAGVIARRQARVDVGHPLPARALRIEVSVEHAAAAPELELEAGAVADLERRLTEQLDQLARGRTNEVAVHDLRLRSDRSRGLHGGRLRCARDATRKKETGSGD